MTAELLSDQAHHIYKTRAVCAIQGVVFTGLEECAWDQRHE
jgi:hypothetical protein